MVPFSFGCGSAVFAARATLAPSRAARSAIASPMPRLPPDTNSVLPLIDVIRRTPVGSALRIASARDCFFLLPPPLWGRVGVGVAASPVYVAYPLSSPLPHKGGTTERGSLYRSTKRLH